MPECVPRRLGATRACALPLPEPRASGFWVGGRGPVGVKPERNQRGEMMTTETRTLVPPHRSPDTTPIIYFDIVPAHGVMNGVIQIELSARTMAPIPDGGVQIMGVGRLRCSPMAAKYLRNSIDESLKMFEE